MNELTLKQNAFTQYLTDSSNKTTYNNGLESARAAGYKGNDNTLTVIASQNLTKLNVKQAIADIEAERQVKNKNNQEQATFELERRIGYLEQKAKEGNVQAIQAQTSLFRELNEVRGLHKQRIIDETDQQRELTASEKAESDLYTAWRLKQGGTIKFTG